MSFLLFLSDAVIPIFIFVIVGYGLLTGCNIYDTFIHGAIRGLKIVVQILPTLVGLMVAVGILRASGFMAWFAGLLAFPKKILISEDSSNSTSRSLAAPSFFFFVVSTSILSAR